MQNILGFLSLAIILYLSFRHKFPIFGMAALEIVSAAKTAITGGAFEALNDTNNNSTRVRDFPQQLADGSQPQAHVLSMWDRDTQHGAFFRMKSPLFHDDVDGIQTSVAANIVSVDFPMALGTQVLSPNDKLTMQVNGTASDDADKTLLAYYEYLPGTDARFIDNQVLKLKGSHIVGVQLLITPTVSEDYSGQRALVADFDRIRAGYDYALLGGYVTGNQCSTVRLTASEWGNLGIGFPGTIQSGASFSGVNQSRWFPLLSELYGTPLIPVFNGSNKNNVLVDVLQNAAHGTCQLTIFCQLLKK
jgi:hypothetical protein